MQNETQIGLRKPKENQAGTLEEEPNRFRFGSWKQIGSPAKTQIGRTQISSTQMEANRGNKRNRKQSTGPNRIGKYQAKLETKMD